MKRLNIERKCVPKGVRKLDLKERLEIVEGIKLEYGIQGYLSTNDADYLIETIEQLDTQTEILKDALEDETRRKNALAKDWSNIVDERNSLQEKVKQFEKIKELSNAEDITLADFAKEVLRIIEGRELPTRKERS